MIVVDQETIRNYNQSATQIVELHSALIPKNLYKIINRFFIKEELTIDVGCGIGRDCHWLLKNGFHVIGIDASEQMLVQARGIYNGIDFINGSLPLLDGVKDEVFTNVLCSAVIMHLDTSEINKAINNLLRVMIDGGIIVISFRGTHEKGMRENGKLYTSISDNNFINIFVENGANLLLKEVEHEEERSIEWHNFVFKKQRHPAV